MQYEGSRCPVVPGQICCAKKSLDILMLQSVLKLIGKATGQHEWIGGEKRENLVKVREEGEQRKQ